MDERWSWARWTAVCVSMNVGAGCYVFDEVDYRWDRHRPSSAGQADCALEPRRGADASTADAESDADSAVDSTADGSADSGVDSAVGSDAGSDASSGAELDTDSGADGAAQGPSSQFLPLPPQNPAAAAHGLSGQHGDSAASDTSDLPGPGVGSVDGEFMTLLAACPSILVASDGYPLAVCTQILNLTPIVLLLDPEGAQPLASLEIARDSDLFGGVYPFLDQEDRVVVIDGRDQLLRIGHTRDAQGAWQLRVDSSVTIADAMGGPCEIEPCDSVIGLAPSYDGSVWFATTGGRVGVVSEDGARVAAISLPPGERIANSIATAPAGTAVVTDTALYLLRLQADGSPGIAWRAEYDRGPARKPGQLSHGSGTTPTFFGPKLGVEYVTIVDNASPLEHLLVFRSDGPPVPVCEIELPEPTGLGTENSPIGAGRSVFVTGTYGTSYPRLPADAGDSEPSSALPAGGLTRVDLTSDGSGCQVVWTNALQAAAVPKLSVADTLIYTIEREPLEAADSAASFAYAVVDPERGALLARERVASGPLQDTMQLAGTIAPGRVIYQGAVAGILRIRPAP